MDTIIPEDISYLNFLSDKNHGLLLQNGQESYEIQDNQSLNVEPIFTELVEGNATWSIGGMPVYLNGPVLAEEDQQENLTTLVETIGSNKVETVDHAAEGFPIEIPGKGFLTSSGLFFSNEVLLELNLQNGNEALVEKPNTVDILSQHIFKKNDLPSTTNEKLVEQQEEVQLEPVAEEQVFSDVDKESNLSDLIEIISVHKCKGCSALFERYEDIVEHLQKTCQPKPVAKPCKVVKRHRVQKMSSLLVTDDNKTPIVKDIYLCGMCENVGYENLENLKEHMLAKHNLTYNSVKEVTAEKPKVESKLTGNRAVFQNMINKQQTEGKTIKCLIKGCSSRFSQLETMMRHHDCHVEGEKKKFKCPKCDKIFFIWRLCNAHMWKCHKIDVGLYTCPVCNSFKTLSSNALLEHMQVHDTMKPFKPFLCALCGKEFKLLSQLKNHEMIHRQPNELLKWIPTKKTCLTCSKVFSSAKILKKHVQAVHNKFKPFICNICGHQCARKAMLELHLRQHTGEKPYKCDVCDYKTGDHNSLRRHINKHYGFTNYSCPHCSYSTIQSITYKQHLKKKHPGKHGCFSCILCSFDTVNEQLYHDHLKEHTMGTTPINIEIINKYAASENINHPTQQMVPNVDDEETDSGLFSSDHHEDMTIDTGGITIPAGSEMLV